MELNESTVEEREREMCGGSMERCGCPKLGGERMRDGERQAENSFACVCSRFLFIYSKFKLGTRREGSLKWKHGAVSLVNPVLLFIFGWRPPPLGLAPSMFMFPVSNDFFIFDK